MFNSIATLLTIISGIKNVIINPLNYLHKNLATHQYEDVNELSKFFKTGQVPYGTYVKLEGVLTEYGHTYKPVTHIPYFPKNVEHNVNGFKGSVTFNSGNFQHPVEKLPEVNYYGNSYKLGYVYPKEFKGFTYKSKYKNEAIAKKNDDLYLDVNETCKPVPVIYSSDIFFNNGDIYNLKAKVVPLPDKTLVSLINHYDDFLSSVHDRYINFTSTEQKSFCLFVEKESGYIKEANYYSAEVFNMSIFVEGHVSPNSHETNLSALINKSVPSIGQEGSPFNVFTVDENYVSLQKGNSIQNERASSAFFTNTNVKVIMRPPGFVGFYVEVDLINENQYKDRLLELKNVIRKFDQQLQVNSNRQMKFHVDFLSDKSLVPFLNLPRYLNSNEVLSLKEDDDNIKDTLSWLSP